MAKTTVMLREDAYEVLKKKYGARGMSKAINEILAEALLKGESMFGTMKNLTQRPERPQEQKMRYVVDSFAWPEYFMGTPAGMAAQECSRFNCRRSNHNTSVTDNRKTAGFSVVSFPV